MSLYIKIRDTQTGQIVRPMNAQFSDKWPKLHDLSNNRWISYNNFTSDSYIFSGNFSSNDNQRYEIYHPRYPKHRFQISNRESTSFRRRSGAMAYLLRSQNIIEIGMTPHHLIPFNGRHRFIFGANLAWLDGRYGWDLKRPLSNASRQNVIEYFNQMQNVFGCHIVRIWLFEGCEGLIFSPGRVEMEEEMAESIRFIQRIARQQNLFIYWCLLSSHPRNNREGFLNDIKIIMSMRNPETSSFLKHALHSFIDAIRERSNNNVFPNVFAIDVMNEPEKYINEEGITWNDIQNYIRACCTEIKNYSGNNLMVSCGCNSAAYLHQPSEEMLERYYQNLGLDFYDYHRYNTEGLDKSFDQLNLDKPCIIGEFGQSGETPWDDDLQRQATSNFIEQSWHLGYGGCLVWNYNYKNFIEVYRRMHHNEEDSQEDEDTEQQAKIKNRTSLINNDGSPRPVSETMSQFNREYSYYTSI